MLVKLMKRSEKVIIEDSIEIITKLMIQDKFKNDNKRYVISKQELYIFCIKLLKEINKYENIKEIKCYEKDKIYL